MADEATQAPEVKVEETTPAPEVKTDESKETIGNVLEEQEKPIKQVPEAALLKEKRARKDLEKRVRELESDRLNGASEEEVSTELDAIGEEFNVEKRLLHKLSDAIEKKVDERVQKSQKDREDAASRENRFAVAYDKALLDNPEYAGIADRDSVRTMSQQMYSKDNKTTFAHVFEKMYGKALPGKRTLESTTPRSGKSPDGIDFTRAKNDAKYFTEIMSNPDTKKEYNDGLVNRVSGNI